MLKRKVTTNAENRNVQPASAVASDQLRNLREQRNPTPKIRCWIQKELLPALTWLGTVPGDKWFHEPSIEILECVAWGTA